MKKRIIFIDITRSFAIILALFDHGMNDFNVWKQYELTNYLLIKGFTSTATPTFLIMFGMMLEIVYRKRLMQNKVFELIQGSLHRSLKCYLGGTLVSVAGLIGGVITLKRVFAVSLFLSNNHFGGILFLYCLLILLSVPIVMMRHFGGFKTLMILNIFVWILYFVLGTIEFSQPHITYLSSLITGVGGARGPSVLQSITFCTVGMFLAAPLAKYDRRKFITRSIWTTLTILSSIFLIINLFSLDSVIKSYITNVFRYANHPLYYLIGSFCAIFWINLFAILFPMGTKMNSPLKHLTVFSRRSLEAFTFGSVLLNIFYFQLPKVGLDVFGPIVFVIVCLFLLIWYEKLREGRLIVGQVRYWYYSVIYDNYLSTFSTKVEILLRNRIVQNP